MMEFTQAHKSYILDQHLVSNQQDKSVDSHLSAFESCTIQSSLDGKDLKEGLSNPAFDQTTESHDFDKHEPTSEFQSSGNPSTIGVSLPSSNNVSLIKLNEMEEMKTKKKKYNGLKNYWGIALTFLSSFCFSLVVLFVKILHGYGFEAYGSSFWRCFGIMILNIPIFLYYECGSGAKYGDSVFHNLIPIREKWNTWLFLLARGIIGPTAITLRFYALEYLTVGDTLAISFSTPVFVTLLAHCFLGEKCGVFPIIAAIATVLGVAIVAKPPMLTGASEFDSGSLIGTVFAVCSMFCSTLVVITTRKLRQVHFTVVIFVISIIGVVQALILTYCLGHFKFPTEINDSFLVAGVACLSFLGQMAMTLALKFEDAGPIALIRCFDVIIGFIFQYAFLHVIPDIFSAIGSAIILAGVLSIGFRKWLNSLPEEDNRRNNWRIILK